MRIHISLSLSIYIYIYMIQPTNSPVYQRLDVVQAVEEVVSTYRHAGTRANI